MENPIKAISSDQITGLVMHYLRLEAAMTPEGVCDATGIKAFSLASMESGRRQCTVWEFLALSMAYKIRPAQAMERITRVCEKLEGSYKVELLANPVCRIDKANRVSRSTLNAWVTRLAIDG